MSGNRRLELVTLFEQCVARQQCLGPVAHSYRLHNMPLLAESYEVECRNLGKVMFDCIEELEAMDRAEGKKK